MCTLNKSTTWENLEFLLSGSVGPNPSWAVCKQTGQLSETSRSGSCQHQVIISPFQPSLTQDNSFLLLLRVFNQKGKPGASAFSCCHLDHFKKINFPQSFFVCTARSYSNFSKVPIISWLCFQMSQVIVFANVYRRTFNDVTHVELPRVWNALLSNVALPCLKKACNWFGLFSWFFWVSANTDTLATQCYLKVKCMTQCSCVVGGWVVDSTHLWTPQWLNCLIKCSH